MAGSTDGRCHQETRQVPAGLLRQCRRSIEAACEEVRHRNACLHPIRFWIEGTQGHGARAFAGNNAAAELLEVPTKPYHQKA
jgi:hypothetical protein